MFKFFGVGSIFTLIEIRIIKRLTSSLEANEIILGILKLSLDFVKKVQILLFDTKNSFGKLIISNILCKGLQ